MAKYRVRMTEYVTTTYEVEADDEEDAFDAIRSGESEVISTESKERNDGFAGPPDDTAVLIEIEKEGTEETNA